MLMCAIMETVLVKHLHKSSENLLLVHNSYLHPSPMITWLQQFHKHRDSLAQFILNLITQVCCLSNVAEVRTLLMGMVATELAFYSK